MIYGFVVLVTISDTFSPPRLPKHFLQHPMASVGASIMPLGFPSLMDKPTMWWPSCVCNSGSGTAGLPLQRDHEGPASADTSEGSVGKFNKNYYCLDGWTRWVDLSYA